MKAIKFMKYMLHYFFCRHSWVFTAKTYRGNEKTGHVEDQYIFECEKCHKRKITKVVDRFSL